LHTSLCGSKSVAILLPWKGSAFATRSHRRLKSFGNLASKAQPAAMVPGSLLTGQQRSVGYTNVLRAKAIHPHPTHLPPCAQRYPRPRLNIHDPLDRQPTLPKRHSSTLGQHLVGLQSRPPLTLLALGPQLFLWYHRNTRTQHRFFRLAHPQSCEREPGIRIPARRAGFLGQDICGGLPE
jgi:hypothetical protein